MNLANVHQVLIASAIVFGAVFALRGAWLMATGGVLADGIGAVGGAALAVGLTFYWRRFRRKLRDRTAASAREAT